jgi:DNA gyrase subunit A
MIITRSGILIRLAVTDLRVMGRATQGVRLINLRDEDAIASVAKVEVEVEENAEDFDIEQNDNLQENEEN